MNIVSKYKAMSMSRRTPFEFDISVSADKKRRANNRSAAVGYEKSARTCDAASCDLIGKYRAPKSPKNVDEFHWFCLKHVKEYNQKWNYFEGHSKEELEDQFRSDSVWERKTSPFRQTSSNKRIHPEGKAWQRLGLENPYDILSSKDTYGKWNTNSGKKRVPPSERKALDILGADDTMSKAEIRKMYKELVKDLHPDRNSGSRADEERLTEVVWAWDQIKVSRILIE